MQAAGFAASPAPVPLAANRENLVADLRARLRANAGPAAEYDDILDDVGLGGYPVVEANLKEAVRLSQSEVSAQGSHFECHQCVACVRSSARQRRFRTALSQALSSQLGLVWNGCSSGCQTSSPPSLHMLTGGGKSSKRKRSRDASVSSASD
eukprot:619933-Amphidinium_carterae.1